MASSDFTEKSELVAKFARKEGDTGSPEVQIALLTKRLEYLTNHFSKHVQDKHSMRGMTKLISRRKGLLAYLKRRDVERYRETIAVLGIRK